jgi:hypothetical protein
MIVLFVEAVMIEERRNLGSILQTINSFARREEFSRNFNHGFHGWTRMRSNNNAYPVGVGREKDDSEIAGAIDSFLFRANQRYPCNPWSVSFGHGYAGTGNPLTR